MIALLPVLLAQSALASTPSLQLLRPPRLPRITANDIRRPTGVLRDGVLTLRLVAHDGPFFPDGEQGRSMPRHAVAEEGQAPSSPAPLIRLPMGTTLRTITPAAPSESALGSTVRSRGEAPKTVPKRCTIRSP
jgi:hypothetical protein